MLADTVPSPPAGDLDDEALLVKAQGSKRFDFTVVEMLRPRPGCCVSPCPELGLRQ